MVVLDFDSTIADSMVSLYAHQETWNGGQHYEMDLSRWDVIDNYEPNVQERLWAYFHSDEGISHIPPRDGAVRSINRLIDHGVFVLVLTDRRLSSQGALREWFARHGVCDRPNDFQITITDRHMTKQDVVRLYLANESYDIVAIADDAPHHMEAFSDVYGDFLVYSFRYPYNAIQIVKGLAKEIATWEEFEKEVLDELARR